MALGLWQASAAIFTLDHLPAQKKLGKKFGAALQGAVYTGIAVTLASFASGAGREHTTSTSDLSVAIMKAPGGFALLLALGSAVAVSGIVYAARGVPPSDRRASTAA